MKINLQKVPEGTALCSPEKFKMSIIAHSLKANDQVDRLLGQSSYEHKIEILKHQTKTALHVLNNFSHRALLADEVGLGKTIEAGIIIKEYLARKLAKKILILVPATLKFQWQEELRSKFDESFHVIQNANEYVQNNLNIASIDTAKTQKHLDELKKMTWDLVIVDEAHKLKNQNTQNYKLVKNLHKDRFLMLTATPLQNNIFELWTLIDLLHPGFLGSKAKFTEQYIEDEQGLKIKNNEILQTKLSNIMIRNLRSDTGIKFAKRNVDTHILDFSDEEMKFYNEAISFIKKQYFEIKNLEKPEVNEDVENSGNLTEQELAEMAIKYRQKGLLTFSLIMLTRQITSSIQTGISAMNRYKETLEDEKQKIQIEALIESAKRISKDTKLECLMKLLKKEKEKVIIFTTFIKTQKQLQVELAMNGISCINFNGTMTPEEKEIAINKFREDKQVLICTDAGSEGRNLQFAHILINYDLPWNPMRIEQRIGRVHRIGQKNDVQIHNISIKNTIESYILDKLYKKINLFEVSIGEMDLILSHLKSKGSVEQNVFDSFFDDSEIVDDFEQAKTESDKVKELDRRIFDDK